MATSYLRPRRGKKALAEEQLGPSNPLKSGEVFFEIPDTGIGTGRGKIKMGDGVTGYADLPYFNDNNSAGDVQDVYLLLEADVWDTETISGKSYYVQTLEVAGVTLNTVPMIIPMYNSEAEMKSYSYISGIKSGDNSIKFIAEQQPTVDVTVVAKFNVNSLSDLDNIVHLVSSKQNKTDANLDTTSKTIVGGINELNDNLTADDNLRFKFVKSGDKYGYLNSNGDFTPFKTAHTGTKIINTVGTTDMGENHEYRYVKTEGLMAIPTATKSISSMGSNIDVLNYAKVNVSIPVGVAWCYMWRGSTAQQYSSCSQMEAVCTEFGIYIRAKVTGKFWDSSTNSVRTISSGSNIVTAGVPDYGNMTFCCAAYVGA